MAVDLNMVDAIKLWIEYGIPAGSCTMLLLAGLYDQAYLHAHPLIKPHWQDHIDFVESLPEACRGENMQKWEEEHRLGRVKPPAGQGGIDD